MRRGREELRRLHEERKGARLEDLVEMDLGVHEDKLDGALLEPGSILLPRHKQDAVMLPICQGLKEGGNLAQGRSVLGEIFLGDRDGN